MTDTPSESTLAEDSRPDLRLQDFSIHVNDQALLSNSNATIPGGKITVIVGGSGAGKSLLLKAIGGLLPRSSGALTWQGGIHLSKEDVVLDQSLKGRVGIVFQQFALFDELSPISNVQFAIDHRSHASTPPKQSAKQWLQELGVPSATPVAKLSGGQMQRLAIARTLASDPEIILYDEPTSGLDAASGQLVAKLIKETQDAHGRTSVVVTHDYQTLLPIADQVLFFDSSSSELVEVDKSQWESIPQRMKPVSLAQPAEQNGVGRIISGLVLGASDRFFQKTGSTVMAALRLPYDLLPIVPRPMWGLRFLGHYLRLVGGLSAWVYLIVAGMIVGFTTTYFTFKFLPFRMYTQPLLVDELLSSIGFALYRFLVPILATVLIAARCGAAVAADVGVKQYGGQVDAMKTLRVRSTRYLLLPIVLAFVIATPFLQWLAFCAAKYVSLIAFAATHQEMDLQFWHQHFFRNLRVQGESLHAGWHWVLLKNVVCGVGTATIGYYQGISPKSSARDVSDSITKTVLWATLFVLLVHFVVALFEFADQTL